MKPTLDMIGIVCKDVAASLRFYKLLGLPVPKLEPDDPYVECKLPSGLRISWNDLEMIKKIEENWVQPIGSRMGLAFLCDSPSSVDATHAEVVASGFSSHKEPWDAFWGQRYAQVVDPDGNIVDLFAPL